MIEFKPSLVEKIRPMETSVRVKGFVSKRIKDLEQNFNDWVIENDAVIVDVKYSKEASPQGSNHIIIAFYMVEV